MIRVAVAMSAKLTLDNLTLKKGDLMVMVGVLGPAVFTVFFVKYMEKYGNLPGMVLSAVSGISVTFILSLFFASPSMAYHHLMRLDGLLYLCWQFQEGRW